MTAHSILSSPGVARSINRFGLDLHRRLAAEGENVVFSPWSIESALAMTWGGASGRTKSEMARVLHFGEEEMAVHRGFQALAADLATHQRESAEAAAREAERGGRAEPLQLTLANRLFGQTGYAFEQPYTEFMHRYYDSPLEALDFSGAPGESSRRVNAWVAEITKNRIPELVTKEMVKDSRLVLTNAVYLKASWEDELGVRPEFPFHVKGGGAKSCAGLGSTRNLKYEKLPDASLVSIPYEGGLQFVLLVPDAVDGLEEMEERLTPEVFESARKATRRLVDLTFPQFKLEPPVVPLTKHLVEMGMPTAFDQPPGTADFSRMALRTPDNYLMIGAVVHRAFLSVDKHGTEAAAATAVVARAGSGRPASGPVKLSVDRPFVFAIQHVESGACLFLGRVTDPR